MESQVFADRAQKVVALNVSGLERRLSLRAARSVLLAAKAFFDSLLLLRRFQPSVVVGLGSYVSLPVVAAAYLMAIPVVIHEQNTRPGLANRLASRVAKAAAISWPGTERFFPIARREITGNPVRPEILKTARNSALDFFSLDARYRTLLVFGGSQGAKHLNDVVIEALPKLQKMGGLQVIHITGKIDYDRVQLALQVGRAKRSGYSCFPYLDEMGLAYAAADLVVCRAGANTLAEITARGLPAVLVPYPYATDNHQEENSALVTQAGGAIMILDSELSGGSLLAALKDTILEPAKLRAMAEKSKELGSPEAAHTLARLVLDVASG